MIQANKLVENHLFLKFVGVYIELYRSKNDCNIIHQYFE